MSIPEHDWKLLRALHQTALERFCERILSECRAVLEDTSLNAHDRYLRLFALTRDRDRELAGAFDDLRRSTALNRLLAMRELGVVTDDDMVAFSAETRGIVDRAESAYKTAGRLRRP